ncbi:MULTISPECIES: hypothetical protein [unclassified Mesorhizobium]|uniref:hypothetical protein n=1 Tax=unclassified Mesorhizobium TaxID=325217 RepID=UPI000BAEEA15|nr:MULTISPECIES: hypothetical protein [unclassified Mesorhizobium]PBC23002.1 hypothetical protein CK226_07290 [Mesorhizobium sp. WSM4311]TRC97667.1 hypothetical protein FJV82_25430 [Mesorhizobium sp. WSM4305]
MFEAFSDADEWLALYASTVGTLRTLTPSEFYDETNNRYHTARDDIMRLVHGLENPPDFREFLDVNAGRKTWLPDSSEALTAMDGTEIHYRVVSNLADERWVDGALNEAFENGTLIPALERIAAEIGKFKLNSSQQTP